MYMYVNKEFSIMKIGYLFKKMRTSSLIILLVWKRQCVSISKGKPLIYFLLNIGYVVYVVLLTRMPPGQGYRKMI